MLIELLRAGICGGDITEETKNNINEENLEELFKLSHKHSVSNIIGDVLFKNKLMPECDMKDVYRISLMTSVAHYQQIRSELQKVSDLFEENKIAHMPLKGSVLRKYYPEPWLRTSCDIDILVKEADLQKAADLLEGKLGYTNKIKEMHDWVMVSQNDVCIELHFKFMNDEVAMGGYIKRTWNADCLKDIWNKSVLLDSKNYRYDMTDELFYFYHVAHMAKHFENGGCGVRSLIDLWILNHIEFDREKRAAVIKSGNLQKFEDAMSLVSERWFSNKHADNVNVIEDYIFNGGIYGSVENQVSVKKSKNGSTFKYIMSRIFLPYDALKHHYPVLETKKWLLPFYQIARWFNLLSPDSAKRSVRELDVSLKQNSNNKTTKMLRELGII